MQARQLPAAAGASWVRAGWRLFRKEPFGFTALLFTYGLLLLASNALVGLIAQTLGSASSFVSIDALAFVGGIFVAILTPALTVGFLQACRAAHQGLPFHPILLFAPFRSGRETVLRLLALGALQMLALIIVIFITSGGDAFKADPPPAASTPPAASATQPTSTTASANPGGAAPATPPALSADTMTPAEQEAAMRAMASHLQEGLAYLPIAMLMWYAPILVAWHRLPVGKALFFGVVALWRNRTAFVVYGVAWLAVWFAMMMGIALVAIMLGLSKAVAFLTAPVVMVLLAWMYCSVYATYDSVFVDEADVSATPAP